MSARITDDSFYLLTVGSPVISNGIAFAIETADDELTEKLISFIFLNDDLGLYEISKLIKEYLKKVKSWCRVKMLTEVDYEIAENRLPRENINIDNLNFVEEIACSRRTLDDIKRHAAIKIVGFSKNEEDVYVPFLIAGDKDIAASSNDNSETIAKEAIARFCTN